MYVSVITKYPSSKLKTTNYLAIFSLPGDLILNCTSPVPLGQDHAYYTSCQADYGDPNDFIKHIETATYQKATAQ